MAALIIAEMGWPFTSLYESILSRNEAEQLKIIRRGMISGRKLYDI